MNKISILRTNALKNKDFQKMYPLTSICKIDMTLCVEGRDDEAELLEKIGKLDEEQMKRIMSKMINAYVDNGFWDDLQQALFTELKRVATLPRRLFKDRIK